jgi:hypothetical protein
MKRIITFSEGVIDGEYKDFICNIIPELTEKFSQRKEYYEYYYKETKVDITLEQIELLNNLFTLEINKEGVRIILN